MRCPNILIRPTLFSAERNMINIDLGDLCATGDENSWIGVSVVVSVTDEQKRPFVDCKMSSQHATIENSGLRYWIRNTSEEVLLKRERRSSEKITNRVQINFTTIKSSDLAEDEGRDANTINLEIELRATHCMEVETKKTITIQFESRFDEQLISKNATVDVLHKGQPITDLDLKMYINTSDVYPGDTVQINTTLKNTERSQCECKLTMLDLHAGPWVVDGVLVDTNKMNAKLNKTDLRRMEIRIEDFVSMDTWNFSVNVRFTELFDFKTFTNLILALNLPQLATFSYPRMKCTGLVDGNRLTWFDLGPMISQIITYQNEDKRFFANLSGKMCAEFTVDDWNLCFDGIYYKNQMVAVWTDEAGLQLPSSG
ncbi:unnamed protein product [Fasciola hepatica]|uniref:FHA domain-containing protein n=2 Tax=Fasciola hepatica TaxID=6192 RepID=A0ABC9HGY7_FASHE